MPIGACLVRGAAAEVLGPGDHGTTFGGNPLACAAALAVLDTLESERLWGQAEPVRNAIVEGFHAHLADPAPVVDVRGMGLMLGIELNIDCSDLVRRALTKGVLINVTSGNTLRLLPPLVMTTTDAHLAGALIAEAVNESALEQGALP
jgi:acetylornithine aminotransferase